MPRYSWFPASTAIKTKNADGVWLMMAADSVVEVAPRPDSPAQIGWIGSPDHTMPQSFLSMYEEQVESLTQYNQYVNGPKFYLLDTHGNAVVLWGAGDSDPWHRDPSGEVYLPSPGEWGTPPWAAVRFEPESSPVFYRLWQFCSEPYIMGTQPGTVYTGFQQWQVCADPGDGEAPVCFTFSLDNSQSMSWIFTQWPFLTDDINTGVGGEVLDHYVDGAEWSDPSSWMTSPGQPLLFQPSGKPVLLRIDPATTDDQYSPHSTTFDNVPVRVWVSGPVSEQGAILFGRESPDDLYEPIKAEDVYKLVELPGEIWLTQFLGRWGYYDNSDPSSDHNGPPGPPLRASFIDIEGVLTPVYLRSEPCSFHNLSIRTGQESALQIQCTP